MAELRASCFLLDTGATRGTGYLVAPRKIATCEHVVRPVGVNGIVAVQSETWAGTATVTRLDVDTDCAILEVAEDIAGAVPVKLARSVANRVPWEGFGFPAISHPVRAGEYVKTGILYLGSISEADARDSENRHRIALYSDMVAAGLAEPQGGISGGPVTVGGAVVGHFATVLSSAAAPGRPILGLVFASRASDVLALLGEPAVEPAPAVGDPVAPVAVPRLEDGRYHAFISYRSTQHEFAKGLADRLEGFGFRVFLDQRELVPGERFANALGQALDRSENGIVLVSRAWLESKWCQDEANAMLRRSNAQGANFRLIPLLLDDARPPGFLAGIQAIDFASEGAPAGPKLTQLAWALLGRTPPRGSAEAKVAATMTQATDAALEELRVVGRDPTRARLLLDTLTKNGLPSVAATLQAASLLIGAGEFWSALAILPRKPSGLREKQLKALALSKLKKHDEALDLLAPMFERGELDAETGGILGGIYRRIWVASKHKDRTALMKAHEVYRTTWERTGDHYPGINCASLGVLLRKKKNAVEVASRVIGILGARPANELDGWQKASLGDACLICGRLDEARSWYEQFSASFDTQPQNIAVTRKATRLIAQALNQDGLLAELPTLLPVPRVVAFSGHMTDAPGRAMPRFPEAKVEVARRRIGEAVDELGGCVVGVCSGARGGDLLFAESVLEARGMVRIMLPFAEARFLHASVGGDGWVDRFRKVTTHPRVLVDVLREDVPSEPEWPAAFAAANAKILDRATELAEAFDDDLPTLLTLWDRRPGDGAGGTGDMVQVWKDRGAGRHVNIDSQAL